MWSRIRALWIPTSDVAFRRSEDRLLSSAGTVVRTYEVELRPGVAIHTAEPEVNVVRTAHTDPLVLCHGFGLGVGAWVANYHGLSRMFSRVLAIDWLGCGLSSRVRFGCRSREQAEEFFVESLEAWRARQRLERMVLCGHSFGGYMAACYALKYPQHVSQLILVSPVGVPERPAEEDSRRTWPLHIRALFAMARVMWVAGVTPQSIVRWFGPWGERITSSYTRARFPNTIDKGLFAEYLYHNCAAPASGEVAISRILAPGAYAFAPLEHRMHELEVPVSFIYGTHDWMDHTAALRAREKMQAHHSRANKKQDNTKVVLVPNAGHQLFVDNPEAFNEAVACCVDGDKCYTHSRLALL